MDTFTESQFKSLLVVFGAALLLTSLLIYWAIECSRRKMNKLVPEAEVKIHLAILRLEEMHADKIARNEF